MLLQSEDLPCFCRSGYLTLEYVSINVLLTSEELPCSCRSGYLTLEYVEEVVLNYTLAEIPLETVVIDTEAWDNREIFELSQGYPLKEFQAFVERLHRNGQKWVSMSPA